MLSCVALWLCVCVAWCMLLTSGHVHVPVYVCLLRAVSVCWGLCVSAQDQDVFLECYIGQLAKRLLSNKFQSLAYETDAVSHMKALFGPHFTGRIANLLGNFKLVTDTHKEEAVAIEEGKEEVAFRVMPLQMSCWPLFPMFPDTVLPPAMNFLKIRFNQRYTAANPMNEVRRVALCLCVCVPSRWL